MEMHIISFQEFNQYTLLPLHVWHGTLGGHPYPGEKPRLATVLRANGGPGVLLFFLGLDDLEGSDLAGDGGAFKAVAAPTHGPHHAPGDRG
jgi:hypothetical protein